MAKRIGLLGLLLVALQGCAHHGLIVRVERYQPYYLESASPVEERWIALAAALQLDGWRVTAFDEGRRTLFAVREAAGATLRDHLRVTLSPTRTQIAIQTAAIDGIQRWNDAIVCSSYGFARERALAQLIERLASETLAPPLGATIASVGLMPPSPTR